jgi:S1-C subfamily serine protease
MIASTIANGPAARAGLSAGEIIVSAAGQPTPSVDDLTTELATTRPGQRIAVAVRSGTGTRTVDVTLAELPAGRG